MSYPSNILLPTDYKSFGIIDSKHKFNANWDIAWSFSFSLSSNPSSQHGISTFLSKTPTISAYPGHYMGIVGPDHDNIVLSINFDSTGYSALSTVYSNGVPSSSIKTNSLIIRSNNNIILNTELSSLDTSFILASSNKYWQTLRFIYASSGKKLYIDYKTTSDYINLLTITLSGNTWLADASILYPGLTFNSPISSNNSIFSNFYLKNFHVQGNINDPSYEYVTYTPITSINPTMYTSLTGVSAYPV